MHWILPTGRSWQSITAGYLGLIGLMLMPLAPLAILFGIWGLVRARRGGHGTGRSIFGIITGVLGTALMIYITLYLGWPWAEPLAD